MDTGEAGPFDVATLLDSFYQSQAQQQQQQQQADQDSAMDFSALDGAPQNFDMGDELSSQSSSGHSPMYSYSNLPEDKQSLGKSRLGT